MKPRRRNYHRKHCGSFHIDSPRLRHKGRRSNHHFLKGELLTDTVAGQLFVSGKKHSMAFFNSAIRILQTLLIALGAGLGTGVRSTCSKDMATTTPARMLMYGKEASNRKQ